MEENQPVLKWAAFTEAGQQFYLAATDKGLCYLSLGDDPFEKLERWSTRFLPNARLVRDPEFLTPYWQQVSEYLAGNRREFSIPLDLRGTSFQVQVWQALYQIPYGETVSYGAVSERIGNPRAVRAVGGAVGANPISIVIPCHRVLGKDQSLTGYSGGKGLPSKIELLQIEGVLLPT